MFFAIGKGIFLRAFSAQPEVLNGMGIRRLLFRAVGFMKAEKVSVPIVE